MLISIMYHHVNSDRCSNGLALFEAHLQYISRHYTSLWPSDPVVKNSVCLVFDDAYADFYFLIYPLLKKYRLKALLAIPAGFILDDCDQPQATRLAPAHNELFAYYRQGTFCTFAEIHEMLDSGLVRPASHSCNHLNLLDTGVDLELELVGSKQLLEKKLGTTVDSFVFPFGKYNQALLQQAKRHYIYCFRIGNAIHKDFSGINGVIYRIKGDELQSPDEIFRPGKLFAYRLKGLLKQLGNQ